MTQEIQSAPAFIYDVTCRDMDGREKWRERVHNFVTTSGKTDIINQYFKGSSYTAAWYMGLKASGPASAGDTPASHGNWAEITPYPGSRPAIAFGTTSGGSNTAGTVNFAINATANVAGAFICSAGSGTGGILYSASDFSVLRGVASGDTLTVTPTVSVS